MEKWLESYGHWPPINQLLFSCVALLAGMMLLFLVGIWTLYIAQRIAVMLRGWPNKTDTKQASTAVDTGTVNILLHKVLDRLEIPQQSSRLNVPGLDWEKERKLIAEEERSLAEAKQRQASQDVNGK